ncbi:MAG: glycosyltransferase [Oscillospiraceae bacterium]|nr:glycosyltransferase [Oscillospiraceae bacterium]
MDTSACMVSVVCTAYNHAAYLRDALEGFVGQKTDFPFEILVNDDASTDDTAAILREYAARYPALIRPFYQEKNLYSQGISIYDAVLYPAARGRYIALCEGDDYWTDPEKLQRQVDFLEAHPDYSACVHNTVTHMTDGSAPDQVLFPQEGDRDIPFETVIRGMSFAFHTSSILARREFLLDPPAFRAVAFRHGFTDYAVGVWLTLQGKVRFLDRCMSVYRIGSNPSAWSSKVEGQYDKFKQFVVGKREMLRAVKPYVTDEQAALVDRVILEREYELLYLTGRVDEMMKPPYDVLFRQQSAFHRVVTRMKAAFPALHRLYRRHKGYGDLG